MISKIISDLIKKTYSCQEFIQSYLEKVEKYNKVVNAFITINKEGALRQARHIDLLIKKSHADKSIFSKYPLLGIPIGHKDVYSTKGVETTAASNILRGYIPPFNATVVEKAENKGAVMIGKLNCDAFAHGATGENSDFGPTKNPYNLERTPGGSSSGSAVAVSMGMCVVGTGTDTGGSLRSPASFTNTVAIKPTYGRVSRYGIIAMASSTDSIGHITRTIEDNAIYLSITAGFDPHDATSSTHPVDSYTKNLGKSIASFKIGVPREYFTKDIDKEIRESVQRAILLLEKNGAKLVEVSLPSTQYALSVYYIIQPSEVSSNLARFDGIRFGHGRDLFGSEAKRRIMIGTYVLSKGYYEAYYIKAQKVRTLIIKDFQNAFKKVDALIAPVSPVMPPKIGKQINDPMKNYLMDVLLVPANIAGIPSLSVPAGFSKEGLPIGLQIMGNYFEEKKLYQIGYVLEQEFKWYKKRPNINTIK